MDIRKIQRLIQLLHESDVTEIEVTEGEERIRISRQMAVPAPVNATIYAPAPQPAAAPVQTAAVVETPTLPEETGHVVTSPMVGSLYRSPTPEAPPFVEIGDRVKVGQTLCIIEAMKILNEIEADAAGRITRILVENGHPVEYGEPLFVIETDA